MPTYLFESPKGERIEREFPIGSCPDKIGRFRKILAPVQFCVPEQHQACNDTEKVRHRHYRCNKEAAEGLANGTYMEPQDRGVTGEGQTRESVAQFNDMYVRAKGNTSAIR